MAARVSDEEMAARVSDEEMAATMKSHNEVVVFVQGFTGVSQTEMFSDLQRNWKLPEIFAREGFQTVLADVSPFNSNWDRACELYASLTGGKVDYGIAHSSKCNHDRYGKDMPAVYPEWDEDHPVHMLGHSMGGMTIRMLDHLLHEGNQAEVDAALAAGEAPHPLFTGGKASWIKSITTVASPHDGSTLAKYGTEKEVGYVLGTFMKLGLVVLGEALAGNWFYDIDSKHHRLFSITDGSYKDFALQDLSPAKALEMQQMMPMAYEDRRYFSFSAFTTRPSAKDSSVQVASPHTMPATMKPLANIMGGWYSTWYKPFDFSEMLRTNDGAVPLHAARCPHLAYSSEEVKSKSGMYDEMSAQWGPGKWWYKDVELSHLEVFYTKFTPGDARGDWARETFEEMYRMHARRILASENLGSWSAVTPVTTTRTASALDL